ASLAALIAGDSTAYWLSKAAAAHLARCVARQYATSKIRCNALCPGKVATNISAARRAAGPQPPRARSSAPVPVKIEGFVDRWADPAEIAAFALFLASDESSFMTGGVYPIDNGAAAR